MINIPFQFRSDKVLEIGDLLPTLPVGLRLKAHSDCVPLSTEEEAFVKNITTAAENATTPLLLGISAIGDLLASAAEDVSPESIRDIGWLIQSLGKQAFHLNELKEHGGDMLSQNNKNKIAPASGGMMS